MNRVGDHSNTTQIRLQAEHLKVCVWNAQSLANQLSSFQSYILASDYGLVAITETWLNPNILDGEILPNFTICRKDRVLREGGVMLGI